MKRLFLFLTSILIIGYCAIPALAQGPDTGQHIGDVILYAGNAYSTLPYGFLRCDGSAISRTGIYADLFNVISTTYGVGNGTTTFNIPNTSGIFVLGASGDTPGSTSCGNQTCSLQRGATGGVYAHQLTVGELATHRHGTYRRILYPLTGGSAALVDVPSTPSYTDYAGSNEAHNNMPPYVSMYYIIAYTTAITSAAPTATPTTQPTYTPAATYTPAPTYTPMPTYTPENTQTPAATYTPEPTYTPENTQTPAATYTPEPTFTPQPTYTPESCEIICGVTPTATLTTDFPTTGILDDFNRDDEGPPPSANWVTISSGIKVISNQGGTFPISDGSAYWDDTFTDSDVYITVKTLVRDYSNLELWARYKEGDGTAYALQWHRNDAEGDTIKLLRFDDEDLVELGSFSQDVSVDDALGMRLAGSKIDLYYKPSGGSWGSILSVDDSTYADAGYLVLSLGDSTVRVDDFGGGDYIGPEITPTPVAMITPDAYTYTMDSGNTLYVPIIFRFGEIILATCALLLSGVLGLSFLFRS